MKKILLLEKALAVNSFLCEILIYIVYTIKEILVHLSTEFHLDLNNVQILL